jgi:hypothetical protein
VSTVIGVACEDNGHFAVVSRLVDDALVASHGWLGGILDDCRTWRGLKGGEAWYKYDPGDAKDLRPLEINGTRVKLHGPIKGEPLKPEASMWRKVLLLFCHATPRPQVVILARDLDGYAKRLEGINQVRENLEWPFQVVVAAPQPEIEAWQVSGFTPANPREQLLLDTLRRELSFDPTTESHRLTSHPNDKPTDAKRVLKHLCEDDRARGEACLTSGATLRERGGRNGAKAFLDEVDEHVLPLPVAP